MMDTFVKRLPGNHKAKDESTPDVTTTKRKTRKHDEAYLTLSFTSTAVGNEEEPQCVSQNISFWHYEAEQVRMPLGDFTSQTQREAHWCLRKKLLNFHAQQSCFTKAASVPSNAQLASYKVVYQQAVGFFYLQKGGAAEKVWEPLDYTVNALSHAPSTTVVAKTPAELM